MASASTGTGRFVAELRLRHQAKQEARAADAAEPIPPPTPRKLIPASGVARHLALIIVPATLLVCAISNTVVSSSLAAKISKVAVATVALGVTDVLLALLRSPARWLWIHAIANAVVVLGCWEDTAHSPAE